MYSRLAALFGVAAGAGILGYLHYAQSPDEDAAAVASPPAAIEWPSSSHAAIRRQTVERATKRDRLPLAVAVAGRTDRDDPPPARPRGADGRGSEPAPGLARDARRGEGLTRLVTLASAPFPYRGLEPRGRTPFLNVSDGGRQGRRTPSGRVYWADETYADSRVLLHVPAGFDPARPGYIVLFFHGHGATLERDVLARQRVPDQIAASGANAVLAAPQFAVDARDSSAGKFWTPGGARRFLEEVADALARLDGRPEARRAFAALPVVIVGYSGGYLPAAAALAHGGLAERVRGVVLLDGLYGELDTFADWIGRHRRGVFVSAYTDSTRRRNEELKARLASDGIGVGAELAGPLRPGSVVFLDAAGSHRDYVTRAWTADPVADVLARLAEGASRTRGDFLALRAPDGGSLRP